MGSACYGGYVHGFVRPLFSHPTTPSYLTHFHFRPSIVTNWSGPTEFATKDTAYLLPVEELETVPYSFEGGSGIEKWAKV
jgi:hypothetical protein